MSEIINISKNNFFLIKAFRNLFEHRALWLYLLCDEAKKKGLEWEDFACAAVKRCGMYHGNNYVEKGHTKSLKGLKKLVFSGMGKKIFEMKIIKSTENELFIDFHYCPLVNAWKKQNCTNSEIERLCDRAMCGDRGIAEKYEVVFDLPKTIARSEGVCELRFHKESGFTLITLILNSPLSIYLCKNINTK